MGVLKSLLVLMGVLKSLLVLLGVLLGLMGLKRAAGFTVTDARPV